MSYLGELRQNARPLAAASLGSGSGLLLMAYITTIFGPYLVQEFHWTRAQFALIGLSMFTTLASLPFIGRLTDRLGVRAAASIGHIGVPACLFGYSMMSGNFWVYFALSCLILALGSFTSPVVWTRPIAADFHRARGLALTVVMLTPAFLGLAGAYLLTRFIEGYGWREGYRLMAALMLVGGMTAVLIMPRRDRSAAHAQEPPSRARGDFAVILSSRPFWIIFAAMVLCTLQTPLTASQLGMVLRDNGLNGLVSAEMITVFTAGTIVGRLTCGLALDRFSARWVAAVSMILPALGWAILAGPWDTAAAIGVAIFLVGITIGAENDLMAFLVARHYRLEIFSTTLSLVYFGVYLGGAAGSVAISATLKHFDSFAPYLAAMVVAIAVGSMLFLLLPKDGEFERIGQ